MLFIKHQRHVIVMLCENVCVTYSPHPRIKMFGWKLCDSAIASKVNWAKRLQDVNMNCDVCSVIE